MVNAGVNVSCFCVSCRSADGIGINPAQTAGECCAVGPPWLRREQAGVSVHQGVMTIFTLLTRD